MRISNVMTPDVRAIAPDRTVRDAARLMDELNVGVLPVCLDGRLLGIITDRDITVRSTAAGAAPGEQSVQEIMTSDLISCGPDDDAAEVLRRMSALQVRRMPVVDEVGRLVGIVSLGDLAVDGAPETDEALRRISTPAEPDRSGTPSTARADAARPQAGSPVRRGAARTQSATERSSWTPPRRGPGTGRIGRDALGRPRLQRRRQRQGRLRQLRQSGLGRRHWPHAGWLRR
jgi:CBS domain-containing protein